MQTENDNRMKHLLAWKGKKNKKSNNQKFSKGSSWAFCINSYATELTMTTTKLSVVGWLKFSGIELDSCFEFELLRA